MSPFRVRLARRPSSRPPDTNSAAMDELEAAAAVLAMDIDSDADLDSELEASLTILEVIFHRQALRSQLQWTR